MRVRDLDLGIIAELMRNSRISNKELSKRIGVSQSVVARAHARLKKEGFIQEYTVVPSFSKLGFTVLSLTFVKLEKFLTPEEIGAAKELIRKTLKSMPLRVVMLERGTGMDSDGVIISYHEDFTAHTKFMDFLKGTGFLKMDEIRSFRVDLMDEVSFIPLTFSLMAEYISGMRKTKGS
jgi:DNA-binding Lrp family transcriptional regulator